MPAPTPLNAYEEMLRADRAELEAAALRGQLARVLVMADSWERSFQTIDAAVAAEALRGVVHPDSTRPRRAHTGPGS